MTTPTEFVLWLNGAADVHAAKSSVASAFPSTSPEKTSFFDAMAARIKGAV